MPISGLNHVIFNQFAILKTQFESIEEIQGELWFGHTGKFRLYLNEELIYSGINNNPYHCSVQPFQWDSNIIQTTFRKGKNKIVIAIG